MTEYKNGRHILRLTATGETTWTLRLVEPTAATVLQDVDINEAWAYIDDNNYVKA